MKGARGRALGGSLAVILATGTPGAQTIPSRLPAGATGAGASLRTALELGTAFSDVADQALPSVVAIFVDIVRPASDVQLMPLPGFWGVMPAPGQTETQHGAGSGVILRADGAILTNNHVVEDATRIRVRLNDGRMFPGRVLGTDPASDLAVVKIDVEGLPTARLGDSDAARVGEWVLAIGAPFGLEATVTHGVLSAKGRGGIGANVIEDYLQTDASINPGNSGGPLVNLHGDVLGINTMVVGRGQGIGFAVPARIARMVAQQILDTGRVTRGWMGAGTQDATPDIAAAFGVSPGGGAVVSIVAPDGPAARAGLRVGDVVTAVDGRTVHGEHDVAREVASHGVGERITLAVLRSGHRSEMTVTTDLRPGESVAPRRPPAAPPQPGPTGFGVTIDTLDPVMAQRLGVTGIQGVVVLDVARGGAADQAGLRPGDVIVLADGHAVTRPAEVVDAARDGHAVLLVRRGAAQEFVGLSVGR